MVCLYQAISLGLRAPLDQLGGDEMGGGGLGEEDLECSLNASHQLFCDISQLKNRRKAAKKCLLVDADLHTNLLWFQGA